MCNVNLVTFKWATEPATYVKKSLKLFVVFNSLHICRFSISYAKAWNYTFPLLNHFFKFP